MPTQSDYAGAIVDTSFAADVTDQTPVSEVTVTGHTTWWTVWVAAGIAIGWLLFAPGARLVERGRDQQHGRGRGKRLPVQRLRRVSVWAFGSVTCARPPFPSDGRGGPLAGR